MLPVKKCPSVFAGPPPSNSICVTSKEFPNKIQDAPITVYSGHPNEMQDAEPDNSICVFVLKSELKIEILEGVNKSFRPIGVGRNANNLRGTRGN